MKCLLIAHNPFWSERQMRGGEFSIGNIVKYMAEQGDEIFIFQDRNGKSPHENIKILPILRKTASVPSHYTPGKWSETQNYEIEFKDVGRVKDIKLEELFKEVDVMFSWSTTGKELFALFERFGIPYVFNIRFWSLFTGPDWMGKKITNKKHFNLKGDLFYNAAFLIANSEYVKKVIKGFYNIDSDVVYPPVDPEEVLVKRSSRGKYITVVGDNPQSGHLLLAKLAIKMPKLNFWALGFDPKDVRVGKDDLIDFLFLSNLKIDTKYISNRKKIFRQTKIMLCPRQHDETFGRIALESMINGIPVICSNCGGMEEIVPRDYVIPNFDNDPNEWTEKINYVLHNYSAVSEEIKIHAKQRRFNCKSNCRKFRNILLEASKRERKTTYTSPSEELIRRYLH